MNKYTLILVLAFLSAPELCFAHYGMAGCGLGSAVISSNGGAQVFAATTNGTFGSQTFGITFGTSNCESSGSMARQARVENYVLANYRALQNDIARGSGEALDGLSELLDEKDVPAFSAQLKANYTKIYSRPNPSSEQVTLALLALKK